MQYDRPVMGSPSRINSNWLLLLQSFHKLSLGVNVCVQICIVFILSVLKLCLKHILGFKIQFVQINSWNLEIHLVHWFIIRFLKRKPEVMNSIFNIIPNDQNKISNLSNISLNSVHRKESVVCLFYANFNIYIDNTQLSVILTGLLG